MKRIFIVSFLILCQLVNAQELSYDSRKIVEKGMNCFNSGDYDCCVINLEAFLKRNESILNQQQKDATYGMLRSAYFSVSSSISDRQIDKLKEYCLRGIELGDRLRKTNDMESVVFHYFMVVYYCFEDEESRMIAWITKLNKIKENCTASSEIKGELNKWIDPNVKLMKNSFNSSSTSITFNLSSIFGGKYTSNQNKVVKKVERKREKSSQSNTYSKGYKYIKEYNYSDHIEYTFQCSSGNFFVVRQFKKSGKIYSSSGSEYNSVAEAASNWAKTNCN